MRQAGKRCRDSLDDADLRTVDDAGNLVLDQDGFSDEVLAACLRWAYAAGYSDAQTDCPPFTVNDASEPWATLPT